MGHFNAFSQSICVWVGFLKHIWIIYTTFIQMHRLYLRRITSFSLLKASLKLHVVFKWDVWTFCEQLRLNSLGWGVQTTAGNKHMFRNESEHWIFLYMLLYVPSHDMDLRSCNIAHVYTSDDHLRLIIWETRSTVLFPRPAIKKKKQKYFYLDVHKNRYTEDKTIIFWTSTAACNVCMQIRLH